MRRNLCSIVAAIPALLVMACALGPDYHRPETKVPAAFRFEPTATTESFADQGWWQVYQDPTLQSLIREALDNNLDVPAVGDSPADTRTAIFAAMAGHIRGKATLIGMYKRT